MDESALVATRRSLHAVAELVIAGPQHRESGTIRLRVVDGGFAGAVSGVRVEGSDFVWDGGRTRLRGTCRDLADAVGVTAAAPEVYAEGSGVGVDDPLTFDPEAMDLLTGWFGRSDAALRRFAPGEEPVLWPEHFDLGVAVGEVNYGASPGDSGHAAPYAYVGPWTAREGPFWNVSFGALKPASALPDADAVAGFFADGRAAL